MVVFVKQLVGGQEWRGGTVPYSDDQSLAPFSPDDSAAMDTGCLSKHQRAALLNKVVAAEILPRLAQVRRGMDLLTDMPAETTEAEMLELVRLLLGEEEADVVSFIDALRLRGATADMLYIGILSEAARHLGELWLADRCDFVQVTLGLGRLQQVARRLSPSFQAQATRRASTASILLLPAPGEQHTFGLLILSEFFHRAGWHVAGGPVSKDFDAALMVRQSWFDVAGFSIGSEKRAEGLAQTISEIRRASRNREITVMVGGPLFLARPGLAAQVGADMTAMDAPGAVRRANQSLKSGIAGT
jgi:MerR family transcriptional regulator, light-induced transcriptional regulator